MPKKWKDVYEEALPDRLPMDVMPYSNEEHVPEDPEPGQVQVMKEAMEECDRAARKLGVSRRAFLQTGAAYAICMTVFNRVAGRNQYALAHNTDTNAACDLEYLGDGTASLPDGLQATNPTGEFIIDCQTHHVDSGGEWRIRNPGTSAFMTVGFAQATSCNELDPMECLSRYHYFKELYLDSSTQMGILSVLPYKDDNDEPPNGQALPLREAVETARMMEQIDGYDGKFGLGGGRRIMIHKFVMPNRGSAGTRSDGAVGRATLGEPVKPLFFDREMELMTQGATDHGMAAGGYLRGWKVYTPWGDGPYTTGWWLDDPAGRGFIEHALDLYNDGLANNLIACHKGFALPAFDQEKAATKDVGIVAKNYWTWPLGGDPVADGDGMNFMIYHSGYDGDSTNFLAVPPTNQGTSANGPYPLDWDTSSTTQPPKLGLGLGSEDDSVVRSLNRGVDNFIKSLRENDWSARRFAATDGTHANVPNVYAELGSVWSAVSASTATVKVRPVDSETPVDVDRASFLLGKLIYYVGAKRITWGTDALWGGSPEDAIRRLRTFNMHGAVRNLYNLPHGLDGDADDPTINAVTEGRPEDSIRNAIFGRNAAIAYRINIPSAIQTIKCGDVQKIRDEYLLNPLASHQKYGPRTRREFFASIRGDSWHRGAIREMNEIERRNRPFFTKRRG